METDMYPDVLTGDRSDHVLRENVHPATWKNPHPPPRYNLVVLGGGYGGILTALEATRAGAKVALIERDRLGGVCLNAGCISSKALIRTSRLYAEMRNAADYGAVTPDNIQVDFGRAMDRMRRVRARASRRLRAARSASPGRGRSGRSPARG